MPKKLEPNNGPRISLYETILGFLFLNGVFAVGVRG